MMKSFNRVITWSLAILILVLLAFAGFKHFRRPPSHVKEMVKFKEMLKEGAPAFTAQEAKEFTEELIPLVEEAAGRKFKQIPKIKLIDRETLAKVLMPDLLPQLINLMPDANSQKIREMGENQVKLMAPLIIGKYGVKDQALYLVPGNVYPIMNLKKINKRHTQAIVKMLIAHELAHALQDQQVGLKQRLDKIEGLEESEAFNATIEGHAVFIQDLVGSKLQIEEALSDSSRLIAAGNVMFDEPMLQMQQKMAEARFEKIYLRGRDFVEYHYKKGGNRKVWQILAAPPADTAMILEPDAYNPAHIEKMDYAALFKGAEKYFGRNEWNIQNSEVPKTMLEGSLTGIDPKDIKELISNVAHVQVLNLRDDRGDGLFGNLTITVLKDNTYGPKYISVLEKIAINNEKKLRNSKMYRMENLISEKFPGINADMARKLSYTLIPAKGKNVRAVIVRICIGNIVLEIIDSNIGLKNEKIIEIAELIFKRLQRSKLSYRLNRPLLFDLNIELLEAA